jgi:hypothetical protein
MGVPKKTKSLLSYCIEQGCTNRRRHFARATIFLRWRLTVLFLGTELVSWHRYGAYRFEAAARFLENLYTFGVDLHVCLSASTVTVDLMDRHE